MLTSHHKQLHGVECKGNTVEVYLDDLQAIKYRHQWSPSISVLHSSVLALAELIICWHHTLFNWDLLRSSSKCVCVCGVYVCACVYTQMRLRERWFYRGKNMDQFTFTWNCTLASVHWDFLKSPGPFLPWGSLAMAAWETHKYLKDKRRWWDKEWEFPKHCWRILLGKIIICYVKIPCLPLDQCFSSYPFFPLTLVFLSLFCLPFLYFFLRFTSEVLSNLWSFS